MRLIKRSFNVYDLETDSDHFHNNLFEVNMYVQDLIKPLDSPLFMNKKSKCFEEISIESNFNKKLTSCSLH